MDSPVTEANAYSIPISLGSSAEQMDRPSENMGGGERSDAHWRAAGSFTSYAEPGKSFLIGFSTTTLRALS